MRGRTGLLILVLTVFFATGVVVTAHQVAGKLDRANSEIEQLKEENNSLRRELNNLLKENENLKSRLQDQKLQSLEEKTGLVRVSDIDPSIVIDLRYATENNFTGKKLYPVAVCLLQKGTAEKLKKASERFKQDGYRIKIWDAYRPLDIQKEMWQLVPDRRYVADPRFGSKHNRGSAVDITLVDGDGNEIEMPTGFDHFSEKAWRSYRGNTPEAQRNMEYLGKVMQENGFIPNTTEWWHFDDSNWKNYPVLNVELEEFVIR